MFFVVKAVVDINCPGVANAILLPMTACHSSMKRPAAAGASKNVSATVPHERYRDRAKKLVAHGIELKNSDETCASPLAE